MGGFFLPKARRYVMTSLDGGTMERGTMDLAAIVQSQYLAALAMLEEAVQKCPASLWDDAQDRNRFWRVAVHILFFTHLYLQEEEAAFAHWEKHRGEAELFGPIFYEGNREPIVAEPYTPAEIL
jgi:hypothetical protein